MKNCGSPFHTEVATKEFMQFLKDQAKVMMLFHFVTDHQYTFVLCMVTGIYVKIMLCTV